MHCLRNQHFLTVFFSVSMDVGQLDLLAGGQCRWGCCGQLPRALSRLRDPWRRWAATNRVTQNVKYLNIMFFFFMYTEACFSTFRNREAQSKLHGVRLVWALSSLRGYLLPLRQHYETCTDMFTSFKCTHHVDFYSSYLFLCFHV